MAAPSPTIYGALSTTTYTTTFTSPYNTPLYVTFATPTIFVPLQYTIITAPPTLSVSGDNSYGETYYRPQTTLTVFPTTLPILVVTELIGVILDPVGHTVTTVTQVQDSSRYTVLRTQDQGNAFACVESTWDCWKSGKKAGIIVGAVLGGIIVLWITLCCCCLCCLRGCSRRHVRIHAHEDVGNEEKGVKMDGARFVVGAPGASGDGGNGRQLLRSQSPLTSTSSDEPPPAMTLRGMSERDISPPRPLPRTCPESPSQRRETKKRSPASSGPSVRARQAPTSRHVSRAPTLDIEDQDLQRLPNSRKGRSGGSSRTRSKRQNVPELRKPHSDSAGNEKLPSRERQKPKMGHRTRKLKGLRSRARSQLPLSERRESHSRRASLSGHGQDRGRGQSHQSHSNRKRLEHRSWSPPPNSKNSSILVSLVPIALLALVKLLEPNNRRSKDKENSENKKGGKSVGRKTRNRTGDVRGEDSTT